MKLKSSKPLILLLFSLVFSPLLNLFAPNVAKALTFEEVYQNQTGRVLGAATAGLVGYWNFDEGSGNTANDSSGNGNNGAISGATWTGGKVGAGALSFNGLNSYVNAGSAPSLDNIQNQGGGGMTVAFWIKPYSNTTNYILSKGPHSSNSGSWEIFKMSVTDPARLVFYKQGTVALQTSWNSTLSSNTWTHVTVIWDGASLVSLYKNGTLAAQGALTGGSNFNSDAAHNLYFGSSNGTSNYLDSDLDEVRIYNRALSALEITDIYNYTGSSSTPTPTITPSPTPTISPTPTPTLTPTPVLNGNKVERLNNLGSLLGAYTTIQACANVVVAGDACVIYPGVYDERVNITRSGTANNPIVFKSATATKPKVKGLLPTNASYITIDGLEVTAVGMADPTDTSFALYHGSILVNGGVGIKIINNYIHDTYSICVGFSNTTFLTISGNIIDHCSVSKQIIGNPGGPYTITTGVNDKIKFTLNGTATYTVTLKPGIGRTASQICADVAALASVPAATSPNAVYCSGVGADGRINIFPVWQGPSTSVVLEDVPNNAYATLGLVIGGESFISQAAGISISTAGLASDILVENNHISRVSDFLLPGGQRYVFRNNILGPSDIANTNHIDGVQSNSPISFLLIEGNESVDNQTSDNHFTLTSASSNNWIFRYNHTLRSKGGVGFGCSLTSCPNAQFYKLAAYNNSWYNTVDYYRAYSGQLSFVNATNNLARNNLWYRAVIDYFRSNPYYVDPNSTLDKDYDLLYQTGNASSTHQIIADPLFTNAALGDFTLQATSPARDAGGPLTSATNQGSNSASLTVTAAYAFQPGWAGVQPDVIAVGSVNNIATISSVDYDTNTITLTSPLSWSVGAPVYLFKDSSGRQVLYGSAPDIGAYEYVSAVAAPTPLSTPTPTPTPTQAPVLPPVNANSSTLPSSSQPSLSPVTTQTNPPPTQINTPAQLRLINDSGTFYLIKEGKRQGITNPGMLFSYGFTFNQAKAATAEDKNLPSGSLLLPNNGALVKSKQDPTVYLISRGQRYGFVSEKVFKGLGFKFSSVLVVTDPELQLLPKISNLDDESKPHAPGLDINRNGTIYWIGDDNKLHGYPTMEIYNSWHIPGDLSNVVPANSADDALVVGEVVDLRKLK